MNKKPLHRHITESGRGAHLTEEERMRMRGVLSAYMAMKPIAYTPTPSPFSFVLFHRPLAAALVAVLFISSAGISYAAEGALPGDVLYSVKTKINEPLSGALALSSEAKAEWAMNVASERAKEAAVLSARGSLDAHTASALQADFAVHTQQALAVLAKKEQDDPEDSAAAAVRFEARLSEYERIVGSLGIEDAGSRSFASAVAEEKQKLAEVRTRAESYATGTATTSSVRIAIASRLSVQAKDSVFSTSRLAQKSLATLSGDSAAEIARAVDTANASVSDGDSLLGKDAPDQALGAFTKALSVSERVRAYLETNAEVHRSTGRSLAQADSRQSEERHAAPAAATMMKAAAPMPVAEVRTMSMTIEASTSASTTATSSEISSEDGRHEDSGNEKKGAVPVHTIIPISVPPPSFDLF